MTGADPSPGVAIVTGAARGIGRGIALRLARDGYMVVLVDRDSDGVARVAREITDSGGRANAEPGDVTDGAAAQGVLDRAVARHGRLDGLVNNAALTAANGLAFAAPWDLDAAEWQRAMRVNLDAPFLWAAAAAPIMRAAGRGSIVNISSVHAQSPNPLTPHYDASKAGLEGFTRSLAVALGPSGVRANCVAPGPIDAQSPDDAPVRPNAGTVLGHDGRPADIAGAVAFLLSDDAAYITGQTLVVDGGMLLLRGRFEPAP